MKFVDRKGRFHDNWLAMQVSNLLIKQGTDEIQDVLPLVEGTMVTVEDDTNLVVKDMFGDILIQGNISPTFTEEEFIEDAINRTLMDLETRIPQMITATQEINNRVTTDPEFSGMLHRIIDLAADTVSQAIKEDAIAVRKGGFAVIQKLIRRRLNL